MSADIATARCAHSQAEPVVLSTGELVACVCIACLRAMPFDWIQGQRQRAQREAYCTHEDEVEIRTLGQVGAEMHCCDCGRTRNE